MEPKLTKNLQVRSLGALLCALLTLSGCQTFSSPFGGEGYDTDPNPIARVGFTDGDPADGSVTQVAVEETLPEKIQKNTDAAIKFLTLKEQENGVRAKDLYRQGDQLFRQAGSQPQDQAQKTYLDSAALFRRAGEAAPKTALEQDALYMQAESLFFADRLTEASDVYQTLQKQYPRNRHLDKVGARQFAISQYWVDVAKTQEGKWFTLNLTDPKRPRIDVDGHAIRVLDQIRFDDPTGRLADDATMAAAAEYIRQKKFEQADEFLTDLRETFSDSEHLFLAHLLGIKCKLESYAGAAYSGLVLEEAEKLVKQTRQRFPDKLSEQKYGDMVDRAAAEISRHRADRLAYRASYRENRNEYAAARYYYNQLLERFPNTPHADTARTQLAKLEKLPDLPKQRLSWLTTIFPDSRRKDPLQTTMPTEGQAEETILR